MCQYFLKWRGMSVTKSQLITTELPPPLPLSPINASYDRYRVMRAVFTFPRVTMCCLLFWDQKKKKSCSFPLAIWPRRAHTVTGLLTCFQLSVDGARWTEAHRDVRFRPEEERREGGEGGKHGNKRLFLDVCRRGG